MFFFLVVVVHFFICCTSRYPFTLKLDRKNIDAAMIFGKGQEDKSRHALLTSTDATSPLGCGQEKREESKPHNGCVMSLCNVNAMALQVLVLRRGKEKLLARINMSMQSARQTNKSE